MRGIADGLLQAGRRRVTENPTRQCRSGVVSLPSAPLARSVEHEGARLETQRRQRQQARRSALAATRSPAVLTLACPRPLAAAAAPVAEAPVELPSVELELEADGQLSDVVAATPKPSQAGGLGGVAGAPLGAPAAGLLIPQVCAKRLRAPICSLFSWWPVLVAVVLVLLCLSVGVVGAIDRRFEAMAGRIAALEEELGGGQLVLAPSCGVD